MSTNGTIFTSHWLYSGSAWRNSNINELAAKVIRLDSSAQPAALDRGRIIYEKEWQAVGSYSYAYCKPGQSSSRLAPALVLRQQDRLVEQLCMSQLRSFTAVLQSPRLALSASISASISLTSCLQAMATQISRESSLQLLSQATQAATYGPQGSLNHIASCVAALSMQSMLRVAVQELAMMRFTGTNVDLAYPLHSMPEHGRSNPAAGQADETETSDVYGRSLVANLWHAPLLVVQETKASQVCVYSLA